MYQGTAKAIMTSLQLRLRWTVRRMTAKAESEIEAPDDVPDVKMNVEESEEESDDEVVPVQYPVNEVTGSEMAARMRIRRVISAREVYQCANESIATIITILCVPGMQALYQPMVKKGGKEGNCVLQLIYLIRRRANENTIKLGRGKCPVNLLPIEANQENLLAQKDSLRDDKGQVTVFHNTTGEVFTTPEAYEQVKHTHDIIGAFFVTDKLSSCVENPGLISPEKCSHVFKVSRIEMVDGKQKVICIPVTINHLDTLKSGGDKSYWLTISSHCLCTLMVAQRTGVCNAHLQENPEI